MDWVAERKDSATFSSTKEERTKIYKEYEELLQKEAKKYLEVGEKIQQKIKETQDKE